MQAQAQPLSEGQTASIRQALAGLSAEQLHWVSGYAAGLAASGAQQPAAELKDSHHILYGSQTGNGEALAKGLAEKLRRNGVPVTLRSLADFRLRALGKVRSATFIVSTHGEGDPPDDAELFREALLDERAGRLEQLQFNVLALGDSSYVNFCQTGREFDRRLEELGARRLTPLVEADVDYRATAEAFDRQTMAALPASATARPATPILRAVPDAPPRYDADTPFRARVLSNQRITGRDSSKDVHHIELSLEGSGIQYLPGDALAVVPRNAAAVVDALLDQTGLSGAEQVTIGRHAMPLQEALRSRLELSRVGAAFLRRWAEHAQIDALRNTLDNPAELAALMAGHQVLDVIRQYPAATDASSLLGCLQRIAPRAYSIASSALASPDEVHLTVAALRFDVDGQVRGGAASSCLVDQLQTDDGLEVFLQPNTRFRLPDDPDTPIIMIGPGTGVAPFRSFIEQRIETGASGKSWLFFGDRNASSDFLYQLEWQRHLKSGALSRMDVAFSRDQADKIYVQDRLREHGRELLDWLENGASIFVCGDASRMAPDVNAALVEIISRHGGVSEERAAERLKALRGEGRYRRDVY